QLLDLPLSRLGRPVRDHRAVGGPPGVRARAGRVASAQPPAPRRRSEDGGRSRGRSAGVLIPVRGLRQLFGMIRKVFFARLGWACAVAALNARESKMRLYALLPASMVPHLS